MLSVRGFFRVIYSITKTGFPKGSPNKMQRHGRNMLTKHIILTAYLNVAFLKNTCDSNTNYHADENDTKSFCTF